MMASLSIPSVSIPSLSIPDVSIPSVAVEIAPAGTGDAPVAREVSVPIQVADVAGMRAAEVRIQFDP